ncbi:YgiQ family radical SAM protein [Acinetobacter sp. SwsAc6]|uniref:YgiQ family radical SAM protein n=1 Tax=Acinetobacter TaxID=469 RepID=UPI000EA2DDC4|nr:MULTISPECIES: YgiQ family radical SAM protein [Acinetobacter]NWK72692.1 YgiQ family radical SAM protein [Acinetobacter sp. SwsAc6]RKG44473.1 YgiQ family radical SAM protein [Acinetobacter cumulans]RKG45981.1 YgiQ family radical SAM protein [Acinetobacter cumulans]RZG61384.1 YgiQ family radical SAM protein [Acinetobacter sp. WCHAc060006]
MSTAYTMQTAPKALFDYDKYWASCFEPAPFLPMSREEMDQLGWDSCDFIFVCGDAYIDHPSFVTGIIGRTLEAQGFRVGIISQPDWTSAEAFKVLGKPNIAWGVSAGNMDSMINRYTADRKIRSDDAYSPDNLPNKRPDRAATVYCQRVREAYPDVPVLLGGIEGSLRRIAHYDYWSDKVRRSILMDSKADLLMYGNGERSIIEVMHRLAKGEKITDITDVRGTAFIINKHNRASKAKFVEIASNDVDTIGRVDPIINPYVMTEDLDGCEIEQDKGNSLANYQNFQKELVANPIVREGDQLDSDTQIVQLQPSSKAIKHKLPPRELAVIRLPAFEEVVNDPVLYAHANRILHLETNPGNARALVQKHGERDVWLNPPPIPLTTEEMDYVFDFPYARLPHPSYGQARFPAFDMIKFSVNIMRGCFGGCTFCSITEHEGRIIQNRSEESILREVEKIRDTAPGFTGIISDLGGPTANMYRLACKDPEIEKNCRKPSCVFPGVCQNLHTDHAPLTQLYRKARALKGIKKILIGSGLRYDLAVLNPEYVKELVTHHVGGYLKIAPEHTEKGPLSKMMKPGIGTYDRFKQMFDRFSKEAGKEQYLIPYFIAAHPGTTDYDMMNLAVWLKKNGFRADQVQTFYPSPMATATTMYYTGKNPLAKVARYTEDVDIVKGEKRRRLHKAFLRYHDPNNWPLLREALKEMGRQDLIGNSKQHLIPTYQPASVEGEYKSARKKNSSVAGDSQKRTGEQGNRTKAAQGQRPSNTKKRPEQGQILTQHTGLPPRETGDKKPFSGSQTKGKSKPKSRA